MLKGRFYVAKIVYMRVEGGSIFLIDWGVVTLGNGVYMEGVCLELFK